MKKEISAVIILLLCISYISAFTVSSLYYNEHPLGLMPGETRDFSMLLQSGKNSETTLKATITQGSDILEITDSSDTYVVEANGKKTVNLRATIPEDAKAGTVYPIKVSFLEVVPGGGMIGFASAIDQNFDVVVVRKPGFFSNLTFNNTWMYVIGGLLIAGIAIFLIQRKKHSKKIGHKRR